MRRSVTVLAVLALVVGGAACAKKLDTGFPSPTISISASPSPQSTEPATAVTLVAKDLKWDLAKLYFKADQTVTVTVDNKDAGIPHNFGVWDSSKKSKELFKPPTNVEGGAKGDYQVSPLKKGTYFFECEIHPTMNGSVEVS